MRVAVVLLEGRVGDRTREAGDHKNYPTTHMVVVNNVHPCDELTFGGETSLPTHSLSRVVPVTEGGGNSCTSHVSRIDGPGKCELMRVIGCHLYSVSAFKEMFSADSINPVRSPLLLTLSTTSCPGTRPN